MGNFGDDIPFILGGMFTILISIPTILVTYVLDYFYPSGAESVTLLCEALFASSLLGFWIALWYSFSIKG